ncbi:hypothetical protein CISG_05366 [Coccidioides immitis RMSCC 3703]|uniref:Uncharacterized protein n=1 Tax=Coccidioides immitis RMSCC 3703 TaxID=454286 RepID=A0A0J8QTC5_COCIT|nr:hypothetical protein CISG_05366 [Coccidioides immitis RMSCC 3703]
MGLVHPQSTYRTKRGMQSCLQEIRKIICRWRNSARFRNECLISWKTCARNVTRLWGAPSLLDGSFGIDSSHGTPDRKNIMGLRRLGPGPMHTCIHLWHHVTAGAQQPKMLHHEFLCCQSSPLKLYPTKSGADGYFDPWTIPLLMNRPDEYYNGMI